MRTSGAKTGARHGELSGLASREYLNLWNISVADISSLPGPTSLARLTLEHHSTRDNSSLSVLTALEWLELDSNVISDIGPLLSNPGLGNGDEVWVIENPSSDRSRNEIIPVLRARGVRVLTHTP